MDVLLIILLIVVALFIIVQLPKNYLKSDPLRKQMELEAEIEEKEEMEERKRAQKELEESKLKAQKEWDRLLSEREKELGGLTKLIKIGGRKEDDIYIYEDTQTIFILGKKYVFKDILSCSVEKVVQKKGQTTYTTSPDSGEMAVQQLLYGMGKSYNVKSTTQVQTTPDHFVYIVTIGIRSISSPQIEFSIKSRSIANEINNLIKVINSINN